MTAMACTKSRIKNRKRAASAASAMARREGEPFAPYHCDECHAWHIGHPIGWRVANQRGHGIARGRQGVSAGYQAVPDGNGGLKVIPSEQWRRDAN